MSENSPKWKNPADIMKHRTVKRRTLTRRKTIHDPTDLTAVLKPTDDRPTVLKRKNPFGCITTNKRQNLGKDICPTIPQNDGTKDFFKALDSTSERIASENATDSSVTQAKQLIDLVERDKENSEYKKLNETTTENQISLRVTDPENQNTEQCTLPLGIDKQTKSKSVHPNLPVDWSVKIKMRIVSEASLAWCTQLKMADEAQAVIQHVQGSQEWEDNEDKRSVFNACCLHWIHPNIPWMRLFPRILPEQKMINLSLVGANEEATQAFHRDWTESFTSVFHLLRSGKCSYFYLCTHQFTVLFRSPGVSQLPSINASLTPTTRGLREALKSEGITFSMPNLGGKKVEDTSPAKNFSGNEVADEVNEENKTTENKTDTTDQLNNCEDEEDDDMIDNDGASIWLESLGLDKKSFPSLDPNKVKIQREGFRRVDNRPESLVYVEGPEVQALFNFLLNCRSCTASSGPQAGIPPTIIAPTAFKGATLKPNKLKHSVAKQTDGAGNIKKGHVIEMSGPILPHQVLNIANILKDIQKEDFTLTFNTHSPTSSFNLRNIPSALPLHGLSKEIDRTGLHPFSHRTLSGPDNLVDIKSYKEVTSIVEGFSFEL